MDKQRKNSHRIAKVNSLIEKELGVILHEFLEGQKGLVTITKVETSGDMRWAKVWVSVLGNNGEKVLEIIKKNIYDIQGAVNRKFATKIIPRLQFFLDTSAEYAQHITEVLDKLKTENSKRKTTT